MPSTGKMSITADDCNIDVNENKQTKNTDVNE